MKCPACEYESPATRVRCPQCRSEYTAADVEAFHHLLYVQQRLELWNLDGLLPRRVAGRLLDLTDRELLRLEERLSLGEQGRSAPAAVVTRVTADPVATTSVAPFPALAAPPIVATPSSAPTVPLSAPTAKLALPRPAAVPARAPMQRLVPPARPVPPPRPARPPFSWKKVGMYLLSERTLNALLGLGAFLILAAALVISTVNPTGLPNLLHLAAMIGTTLVFYGAGSFVQQRLKLMRTGAALLAIGAAFIPLDIWTCGREIMEWDSQTIWLMSSLVCLPIYLASHVWLRDRAFALLSVTAGGSLLLSTLIQLGATPVWGLCGLVGLAIGYLELARRAGHGWEALHWAAFWTAQVMAPVALAALSVLRFGPALLHLSDLSLVSSLQDRLGAQPSASLDYAVGAAWWLASAFYAYATVVSGRRSFAFACGWMLPLAYLFTLTKAPFGAAWYGLCLAALAAGYLGFGRRVQRLLAGTARPSLTVMVQWPAYQVGLALSAIAAAWPLLTLGDHFNTPSAALTLWAVIGIYAVAARSFNHVAFRYAAAYLIPVAAWLSAHEITWFSPASGLSIVVLAACYLLCSRLTSGVPLSYTACMREPLYQVAALLTVIAMLAAPRFISMAEVAILLAVSVLYGSAAFLLRQRAWAYIAVYILPAATALLMQCAALDVGAQVASWAMLAVGLLLAAEVAARRTGEAGRPLVGTALGLAGWRSRFASPFFSCGYGACFLAVALGASNWAAYLSLSPAAILGLLLVVVTLAISAVSRGSSVFLYGATWLFLLPFVAAAGPLYRHLGHTFSAPEGARLVALLGLGYMVLAYLSDRAGRHYAKPIYLAAYALSAIAIVAALPDRALTVQVLAASLLCYGWSAYLVHRGRHPSFQWVVERLFAGSEAVASLLFLCVTVWLFPTWALLVQSLWSPAPAVADYGVLLALLAPAYAVLGLLSGRVRHDYAAPWLLAAYTLSAVGPLLAAADPTLAIVALAISICFYIGAALYSRRVEWLALVAVLGPVLLWEMLYRYSDPVQFMGLALVGLSLAYGVIGLIFHHGGLRDLGQPVRGSCSPFAVPFAAVGQVICVVGLLLDAGTGDPRLVLVGFVLGAIQYVGAAAISRQNVFSTPLATTLAVVYVCSMILFPPAQNHYNLALLPGLAAYLAIGEAFRRRGDAASRQAERRGVAPFFTAWATPFDLLLFLGSLVAFVYALGASTGLTALTWWIISGLYGARCVFRRRPGPLYPALGVALAAYAATVAACVPGISGVDVALSLIVPVWVLTCSVHWLARGGTSRKVVNGSWARPLLLGAGASLMISTATSLGFTTDIMWLGIAYAVLLGLFSVLWESEWLVWGSIAFVVMAYQGALLLAGIPFDAQPLFWALAGLPVALLGLAMQRRQGLVARLWAQPLVFSANGAGIAALCVALGNLTLGRPGLQPLAIVLGVTGLMVLIQGIIGRSVLRQYLGVGLLEGGYACALLFQQVAQPQAYALPAGISLLVLAFIHWRREAGDVKVALEVVGLFVLLGVTLLQGTGGLGAADRYPYDVCLLLESVALFGLGAVLRWKKTFFAASTTLVVAVLILLADPLRSMSTWYLIALIGCLMIGLVVFLEQRRQQIPLWLDDVRLRLETWD